MAPPRISVVVPVLNGVRSLGELLGALAEQSEPDHEVVVVDNGSRDGSDRMAAALGARVIREPRRGRARARNRGVAAATAELIAFTDADCRPEPGWLAALADALERSPLAAGPVALICGQPPNRWERLELLWRFEQEQNVRHGWAATANLGVRREAFAAAGGFREDYRHIGEDVDFCLRARTAGRGLIFCPEAWVSHRAERDPMSIFRRAVIHGWSSEQHTHRWPGVVGWQHWRHPMPVLRGDWALRRFGEAAVQERDLLLPARLEYAGRVLGSISARAARVR